MSKVNIDFNLSAGKVKPMHAVNNGPVMGAGVVDPDKAITNIQDYKAAGIPYARNHDASFNATYGSNHTVDVAFIFPDFDADPYDEASYDFICTDEYMRVTELGGAKTFYRLGTRIEHEIKKYNTYPPKDFKKWAIICEHIIRHYNHGWANGFNYGIEYWEIWNEPDLHVTDKGGKKNWNGTMEQFKEFYNIAANHLKDCFPDIKVGGPGASGDDEFLRDLFASVDTPPDFFSWHIYASTTDEVARRAHIYRKMFDELGYPDTEIILDEWNYYSEEKSIFWDKEGMLYAYNVIASLKGAAFTAAVMCEGQYLPLDMLMYYDARPCAFNGMWKPYTYERLKGYYPFPAFNTLYQLGESVQVNSELANIHLCAAKDESGNAAIMIVNYDDSDSGDASSFSLKMSGIANGKKLEYYLLDEKHDLELIKEEIYNSESELPIILSNNAMLLIKIF